MGVRTEAVGLSARRFNAHNGEVFQLSGNFNAIAPEQLRTPVGFNAQEPRPPRGLEGAGAGAARGCGGSRTHEFQLSLCERVPIQAVRVS